MSIYDYYTSAGSNTVLFPEGMIPSQVNDGMRSVQTDLRLAANDSGWINYGNGSGPPAYTYIDATSFSVTGDATAAYHTGRRLRAAGIITGTIYGAVVSSSFGAGVTTVVAAWDSGSLNSEALTISLSAVPATGGILPPIPAAQLPAASDTVAGAIEIATAAEVNALSDTVRAVTPGRLPVASATQKGIVELATSAEANALADTTRAIVPATLPIASATQQGLIELATDAETLAGTDTARAVTAASLAALAASSGAAGYIKQPGGGKTQFGYFQSNGSGVAVVTFPEAFSTVVLSLTGNAVVPNTAAHVTSVIGFVSVSTSGFTATTYKIGSTSAVFGPTTFYWTAIGF